MSDSNKLWMAYIYNTTPLKYYLNNYLNNILGITSLSCSGYLYTKIIYGNWCQIKSNKP